MAVGMSESCDLSLEAVISRMIGGFVGPSPTGTASMAIRAYSSGGVETHHLQLRKMWDAVSAPRIEVVKIRRGKERVLFALALTPPNSAWSASWLVDHFEEKLIYIRGTGLAGMTMYLEATLSVFELPKTEMTFHSDQSLPGPAWLQRFEDETKAADPDELAQMVHTQAQEQKYKEDRERRLRSMARTWAMLGADTVTAAA